MANDFVESISGARGIVGKSMTSELAMRYGLAFGSFIGGGKIIIGGDPRTSHDQLKSAVASGLMAAGRDVIDIGVCPTPTIGIAIKDMKAQGGVGITASHNPVEWNGIKLFNRKGEFISPQQYEEFRKVIKRSDLPLADYKRVGRLTSDANAVDRHIERILSQSILNIRKIKRSKFKVVVDCVNGGGYIAAPELLRKLGCRVVVINGTPDGKFPRGAEPIPKHLTQLRKKVVIEKADIGFALDPDADRLAIVSDKGVAIGEEHTLALALMAVLSKKTGEVVVNMSTSRMCYDVAEMFGCRFFRSKVGEANVVDVMRRKRAIAGGEGNGGVILPTSHYGRDSLAGMALVLQCLTDTRMTISDAIKTYPNYVIVKDKGELPGDFDIKLQNMKAKLSDVNIDETDGIRIDYPDSWVHIRRSNTEPIFRIISEARSRSIAVRQIRKIKDLLS